MSMSMEAATLREYLTDAISYWEPRRIGYNLVLTAIVVIYFLLGLPGSKTRISLDALLFLTALAVLANVGYCAAYVVDIFAQASGFRDRWRNLRWLLFTVGLIFAGILTRFWAVGIFFDRRSAVP
jgi:hypothetical protein